MDFVTETDKACEDLILHHLQKHYPITSSSARRQQRRSAPPPTSPTTPSFLRCAFLLFSCQDFAYPSHCGFPFMCVSIGLTIGKIRTVRVVYNPIMNELFTAVHGKYAFLSGSQIKTSSQDELGKALLVTEDADASIRKRALELVFLLVNHTNVKPLIKELVNYLVVADPDFKEDLTAKIYSKVEKFFQEKLWYLDHMFKVLSLAILAW